MKAEIKNVGPHARRGDPGLSADQKRHLLPGPVDIVLEFDHSIPTELHPDSGVVTKWGDSALAQWLFSWHSLKAGPDGGPNDPMPLATLEVSIVPEAGKFRLHIEAVQDDQRAKRLGDFERDHQQRMTDLYRFVQNQHYGATQPSCAPSAPEVNLSFEGAALSTVLAAFQKLDAPSRTRVLQAVSGLVGTAIVVNAEPDSLNTEFVMGDFDEDDDGDITEP